MMSGTWWRRVMGTLGLLALTGIAAGAANARDLTVTAWGGASQAAQEKVYYKPFTAKTGINLLQDSWSGGVGVLRTKVQGGNANWDVVQVEVDELLIGCEEGLYEKMDWSKLGGRDKFIPSAVNDCGVGAVVWGVALAYDPEKLKEGPKSWADFWDVKRWPGKRGMRKGAKYTLEIALLADGVAREDVYKVLATPAGVDRAFKKLDELKPYIVWWAAGSQPPEMLASGDVVMSEALTSRIFAANAQNNRNFKIVWKDSLDAVDFWVILKGSPNKDSGMELIQYVTSPDVQKLFPTIIPQGITNKEAIRQVDPANWQNLPNSPDNSKEAIDINPEFWLENYDQLNQRYNAWAAK
jgi:putative spermidine/putrescine transport system substrate-binding protein